MLAVGFDQIVGDRLRLRARGRGYDEVDTLHAVALVHATGGEWGEDLRVLARDTGLLPLLYRPLPSLDARHNCLAAFHDDAQVMRAGRLPRRGESADTRGVKPAHRHGADEAQAAPGAEGTGAGPHRAQVLCRPPSTKTQLPVIMPARSEARKRIMSATSSGSPMRPMGWVVRLRSTKAA